MKHKLILFATASIALAVPSFAQDPFGGGDANDDPFGGGGANPKAGAAANDDPFGGGGGGAESPTNLSVRYEAFSLDLATAATLMRTGTTDSALYETLVGMLKDGKAVQEALTIIRTKPGMRAMSESISETIYPTEWDPAELPNSIGVKIDPPTGPNGQSTGGSPDVDALDKAQKLEELPIFVTPATPTAFETRNTGTSLEVDVNSNANGLIDLVISPEHVTPAGLSEWGQGVNKIPMPEFEIQRIGPQTQVLPGVPRLLGTMNRSPLSKVDRDAAKRIWFAFVTASPVK